MKYRKAGNSGLELPVLGLGCWSFGGGEYWGASEPEDEKRLVHAAYDLGVTYFDTAELYYEGRSEEALGRAVADLPRDRIVIGSKLFPSNAYYDKAIEHCEASLRRLGTDYLDLYMLHWPLNSRSVGAFADDASIVTNPPEVEDTVAALIRLRDQGKIRHIGVSNFGKRWMQEFEREGVQPAVNQLAYNLFSRAIEYEILPYCQASGTGVMGYSVLMQGLLTGRYQSLDDLPAQYCRTRHFKSDRSPDSRHGEKGAEQEMKKALDRLRDISGQTGISMTALSIWWPIQNEAVTCVLAGTRNPDRLKENAEAAMLSLPREAHRELVQAVDEATRPLMEALGQGFDYYENQANDRTICLDDQQK